MDVNDMIALARAGFSRSDIAAMAQAAQPAPAAPAAQPAPAAPAAPAAPSAQAGDMLSQLIAEMKQQTAQNNQLMTALQANAVQQGYQSQPADSIDALTARIINPGD